MKKVVSFLAGALLCGAMFTATAFAENAHVSMDVSGTDIKVGDEITVKVSVSDLSSASTFITGVVFDNDQFECVDLWGPLGADAGADKEWFYLIDPNARRYPEVDADPAPSIATANEIGTLSATWTSSSDMAYTGGEIFTAVLKAKVETDAADIKLFETCDSQADNSQDVNLDGEAGRAFAKVVSVKVAGNEPPAPTASVAIKGAYKTTDAAWIAEKGKTMFWGVDFANGGFNGTAVAKIFSDAKERELTIATPAGAEINGEASFGVFVIVGDSTDAIGLTITSGDVTATAAPVAYADAE